MSNQHHFESSSATSTSQVEEQSWISWLVGVPGNHFLCEVDRAFIEDSFNLFGLKQMVSADFNQALEIILDRADIDDSNNSEIFRTAEQLYGLIHSRFILSGSGLVAMHKKYMRREFGECPRTCCNGQPVLPVGISDDVASTPVKLFCPRCRDVYNAPQAQRHIDGAYFGTTFPHIFLMTFEDLVPPAPTHYYVPRVFGFKIHSSSNSIPKLTHNSTSRAKFELLDNFLPTSEKVSFTQFIDDDANTIQNGQETKHVVVNNSLQHGIAMHADASQMSSKHVSHVEKSMEPSQKKARKR